MLRSIQWGGWSNTHVGVAVGGLVDLGVVDDEEDLYQHMFSILIS